MGRTGELVRQVSDAGYWPAWSPDGTRLAYSSEPTIDVPFTYGGGASVWIARHRNRARARSLTELDGTQPSWSPHDRRIAFWGVDPATQNRDIWTVPVGGGAAVRVTDDPAIDATPVWSSDGRFLYFSSSRGGTTNLWRVPIDETTGATTGAPEPVIVPTQNAVHPSAVARRPAARLHGVGVDQRRLRDGLRPGPGLDRGAAAVDSRRPASLGQPAGVAGRPAPRVRPGQPAAAIWCVTTADGSNVQRLTDERIGVRCPGVVAGRPDHRRAADAPRRQGPHLRRAGRRPLAPRDRSALDRHGRLSGMVAGHHPAVARAGPDRPGHADLRPDEAGGRSTIERLPAHPLGTFYPRAWSPDGTRLGGTIAKTVVVYETRAQHVHGRRAGLPRRGGLPSCLAARQPAAARDGQGQHQSLVVDTATGEVRPVYTAAPDRDPRVQPVASPAGAVRQPRPRGSRHLDRHDSVAVGCSAPCRHRRRCRACSPLPLSPSRRSASRPANPRRRPAPEHHRPRQLHRPQRPRRKRPWPRAASAPSPTAPPSTSTR